MCTAAVARNHLSEVVWVQTGRLAFFDILCGEAAACCLALEAAKRNGCKFIIVESDSKKEVDNITPDVGVVKIMDGTDD
uniref:RNase H type-1 domain-containing protein n=1 Tax=Cannabis sativa TaxID=3483 RepID=A0A803PIA1_CANSA